MPRIKCSVTGNFYSVTTNHLKELVEKFQGKDNLDKDYVSRVARRLRKEGKSDAEIKAMAERGELDSKTSAPRSAKGARKSKASAEETPVENAEPADSEITDFMAGPGK